MNRVATALALITLAMTGVAAAQNMPSQSQTMPPAGTSPPTQYPSSSAPSSSEPGTTNSSDAKAAMKQQVKDCIAQQKANNSSMSKHELKKYCKNQVENSGTTPRD